MLDNFYRSRLSGAEADAYDRIFSALRYRQTSISLRGADGERAQELVSYVSYDHPELLYFDGLKIEVNEGERILRVEFNSFDERLFRERLGALTEKIARGLKEDADEYTRCKAIYDELASFIVYSDSFDEYCSIRLAMGRNDRDAPRRLETFLQTHAEDFSPFGALVRKKAVCQGVSRLFMLLARAFGIQCTVAAARRERDVSDTHMMNVVEIGGKRAFLDVTNGLRSSGALPVIKYHLFLMPQRIVEKFYSVGVDFGCTDEDLNFYKRNGLWFDDAEVLRRYLAAYTQRSLNRELHVYFDGTDPDEGHIRDLCMEVANDHCPAGEHVEAAALRGFFFGRIVDTE